jgi:antitoxin ParD1/3/4
MTTVTISLPESLKEFLKAQIQTKGYGNVSEYFRGLLREAQSKDAEARLGSLLLQGLESGGDDIPLTRKFWKELRSEAARSAAKKSKRRMKNR